MKLRKQLLAVLTAALILCGCTGGYGENIIMDSEEEAWDGTVTLTFFGYKADALNLTAIEEILRGFMDENPDIEIVYEGIKGPAYWDAFGKRRDSGNHDDVFMINHENVVKMGGDMLADLSDVPGTENYSGIMKDQFTNDDGTVYFLPLCVSAYGFYCNLDLLAEYGIGVPQDLSELTAACDYFVSKGITPIVVNNYDSLRTVAEAVSMYPVYMYGDPREFIDMWNTGEKSIAEQAAPGLAFVENMIERGWIDCAEALDTAQTSDDLDIFAKGERPFMITGGWATHRLAAKDPDFEYRVCAYPVLEDGAVLTASPDTCIAVSADSRYTEQAKKLVEYLIQSDVIWQYCDSQSSFSPLEGDERVPSDETAAELYKTYSDGRVVIGSDYRLRFPFDLMMREVTGDMLRGMGAEDARDKLESLVTEYRGGEE